MGRARRSLRTAAEFDRPREISAARTRSPRISRRAFLKTAGATALGLAALGVAPGLLRPGEAAWPSYFFANNLWDTAWTLATSPQSVVNTYLAARKAQGFDTVMMGYGGFGCRNKPLGNGQAPFLGTFSFFNWDTGAYDPVVNLSRPNPAAWHYIDQIITKAASLGLWTAFVPLGNGVADRYVAALRSASTAFNYGVFIGNRYKNVARFVWVLGGDVDPTVDGVFDLTNSLASGIRAAGARQPITFEPSADQSSSEVFQNQPWLTFNGIQSEWASGIVSGDRSLSPVKATGVLEQGYEGYWSADEIYNGTFSAFQAGASYVAYGQDGMYNGSNPGLTPGIGASVAARNDAAAQSSRAPAQAPPATT